MREARGLGRLRKVALTAGAAVALLTVTACGPGWWTPIASEEPTEIGATSDVGAATVEPTIEAEPALTLAVNVADVPGLWNAMAAANGVTDVLPDPLVADDTIDGVSSTTVPIGDGTMFVQWQEDDGKLLTVQLDTIVDGDPTTSTVVPVLEAFAAIGLGLSPTEAPTFVQAALADAIANAVDPVFVDWSAPSDSGNLGISIVAGSGSFVITPVANEAVGLESPEAGDLASASPTS